MLGGLLALISAASFGLNNAILRRGVLTGTAAQSMATSIPIGMAMFLIAIPIASAWGPLTGFSGRSYAILAAAGIVHFIGNRYFITRAIKAMGSNLAGPFQEAGLLWTLILAMVVLGERITLPKIAAILLVVGGPLLIMGDRPKPGGPAPKSLSAEAVSNRPVFVPNYRDGLIFSLLSALCWGTSPVLVRLAMPEGSGVATGIAAATVSYGAATLVLSFILMLPGRFAHVRAMTPQTMVLFLTSGVTVNLSHIFRYMALSVAPVSVVMPIQRTSIVFRLLFARLINPDYELFNWRILAAAALSLAGSLILAVTR